MEENDKALQRFAAVNYIGQLKDHLHENSVMLIDDIYWSADMTEAWQTIRKHRRIRLSVDTFGWGMAFFLADRETDAVLIDYGLYLPNSWIEDPKRLDQARVLPDQRTFKTKPELTWEILKLPGQIG